MSFGSNFEPACELSRAVTSGKRAVFDQSHFEAVGQLGRSIGRQLVAGDRRAFAGGLVRSTVWAHGAAQARQANS